MTYAEFREYAAGLHARLKRGEVLSEREIGPVLRALRDKNRFLRCPEWREFSKAAFPLVDVDGWDGTIRAK